MENIVRFLSVFEPRLTDSAEYFIIHTYLFASILNYEWTLRPVGLTLITNLTVNFYD